MIESGWVWGCYEKGDMVFVEEWEDVLLMKRLKLFVVVVKMNLYEYCVLCIWFVFFLIGWDNVDFDIFFD